MPTVRERHPEHKMWETLEWPETLEICRRCRRGIVVYLGGDTRIPPDQMFASLYHAQPGRERPWCPVCSENEPGEVYRRVGESGVGSVTGPWMPFTASSGAPTAALRAIAPTHERLMVEGFDAPPVTPIPLR